MSGAGPGPITQFRTALQAQPEDGKGPAASAPKEPSAADALVKGLEVVGKQVTNNKKVGEKVIEPLKRAVGGHWDRLSGGEKAGVEGGIKGNMIAADCELRAGFRPLPSQDLDALHAQFGGFANPGDLERYEETFRGPPLPAGGVAGAEERRLQARDLADALGLPVGNAVDFWTEASLFSQGGMTAIVFGPGDIAQAHTADEWIALDQLQSYVSTVSRIINGEAA